MKKNLLILLTGAWLLAACSAAPTAAGQTASPTPARVTLQPYLGPSLTATPSPTSADTPTPLPTATPTPRTHVIARNEDMLGIAFQYGVSLNAMLTANPSANPRALRVGDSLTIPAGQYTPTPDPKNPPLPTPVGLTLTSPHCVAAVSGELWCFVRLENPQTFSVEGAAVRVNLRDADSGALTSQTGYPPLNSLPAGGWLPAVVYFPAPAPKNFDASAELVAALPVAVDAARYLALQAVQPQVSLSADGLSAQISASAALADGQSGPAQVTAAAAAFNAKGEIIGLRSLTLPAQLNAGESQPYTLTLYSASGEAIARVELLQEAVPAAELTATP